MSKPVSYIIEIYKPGSDSDCFYNAFLETALPPLVEGELLTFPDLDLRTRYKIVKIEHSITENEKLFTFQTRIFTEEVKS